MDQKKVKLSKNKGIIWQQYKCKIAFLPMEGLSPIFAANEAANQQVWDVKSSFFAFLITAKWATKIKLVTNDPVIFGSILFLRSFSKMIRLI